AEHRDRALAARVYEAEGAPLRRRIDHRVHGHALLAELRPRAAAEVVVAEGREQHGRAGELDELHGRHGAAAGRGLPGRKRMHDLTGPRHLLDPGELDPFDVPDDADAHRTESHTSLDPLVAQ